MVSTDPNGYTADSPLVVSSTLHEHNAPFSYHVKWTLSNMLYSEDQLKASKSLGK
jgi:hypothetical protein